MTLLLRSTSLQEWAQSCFQPKSISFQGPGVKMSAHFHLAMMAASISHFVTATKFSCRSSNKKNVSFGFLSLALNPCHPFSR